MIQTNEHLSKEPMITREQYEHMDQLHQIAADHAAKNGNLKIVDQEKAKA